ncbi:MAG: hypothetical protein OXN83_06020 [Oligoflexia bacterium]|nr:hypothetical protein [Oligoflexia bacterium]
MNKKNTWKNILSFLKNTIFKSWVYEGFIKKFFKGLSSGVAPSVSQTMIILTPIIISNFIVSYFDKPIINKAIDFQDNYIERALNLSIETKIIRSLTGVQFWSKVLYDSLKAEKINEKQIDSEYKTLKKLFLNWQDNLDKNIEFIKNNISADYVTKRKCIGEKEKSISE